MHALIRYVHISDTLLSDAHKDAFGFRPRHYKTWWTLDELKAEMAKLQQDINIAEEHQARQEAMYLAELEEGIANTINCGAGDRATALRWLFQDEINDIEFGLWKRGIGHADSTRIAAEIRSALHSKENHHAL